MDEDTNQTPGLKPAKKKPGKKRRGGPRPGAGRKPRAPAAPPAAPPAEGNQTAPAPNQTASESPGENQPPGAPAPDPTGDTSADAFGPRPAGDPYAELRRKIARTAPELAPITVGLLAPLLCAVIATHTGCDLAAVEVRARVVSRTGEARGHTCSGAEALGLALAQIGAAVLPDVDGLANHPLAPCALTLGGVGIAVAAHVLAARMPGVSPETMRTMLSQAARSSERAEAAEAAPPSAIPPDPGIPIDEAMGAGAPS